jgi:hypothetical protein
MLYAFNFLREVPLGHILAHIWENGEIGLEDLPAVIKLLEAAFGDLNRVATAEQIIQDINKRTLSSVSNTLDFKLLLSNWIGIHRPDEIP